MTTQEINELVAILDKLFDKKLEAFATKEYIDDKLKSFVTKDYLDEKLLGFATKNDLKAFATKDDLKDFEKRIFRKIDESKYINTQHHLETRAAIGKIEMDVGNIKEKLRSFAEI